MKVLIFMTQFYQSGGAEWLEMKLAEDLNRRGIHADIMSMYTEDLPGVAAAKADLLAKNIPALHFLGMRINPPASSLLPAILRLRRLLREQDYDLVETSGVSPTFIASWATRGTRTRHVAGLHQVLRRDRDNSTAAKFLRFSARFNARSRYYAISDYAAAHWVAYSRTAPAHTRRIYNAIRDDDFLEAADRQGLRSELHLPANARIALFVGRLAADKGIETALDAVGPLLERENLCLLYVGRRDLYVRGTEDMLQRMELKIRESGWSDRVRFMGFTKSIPRLMASSDVLVHPTSIEGFGLVLAEAMAAGLPIVASDVEAIPEVLAGTDSLMVPPGDPRALQAAVLQTLGRTPEETARAIEKGRRRALDFRIDQRANAMIELFQDVLADRF